MASVSIVYRDAATGDTDSTRGEAFSVDPQEIEVEFDHDEKLLRITMLGPQTGVTFKIEAADAVAITRAIVKSQAEYADKLLSELGEGG